MGIRLQLVIITLTAFLSFAGLVFRTSLGVVDQNLRRDHPAGASLAEGPAHWMAEHLAKKQRELAVQLRLLAEEKRAAKTAEFLYWGTFERGPFGLRPAKTAAKSGQVVPAKFLETWQQGFPEKELAARDVAWAPMAFEGTQYFIFAVKQATGAVASGVLPAHWMVGELNRYFSGRYQMSVLDEEGRVYFSPQLDLIGGDGQIVSWIQGWFKNGRPEAIDLKIEGGNYLRVQALAVPGAPLHIVLAEALPGLQAIFGWKLSFFLLTAAFIAFLWGGIGFVVTPLNRALAELSLLSRDLAAGTRRVTADRDHPGLFSSIFQNLARAQVRLQEASGASAKEAVKEAFREPERNQPLAAPLLEEVPPSVLPERSLIEEFFDTAAVSLGALQAAKSYAPEAELEKLEEVERHLRRMKGKAGSLIGYEEDVAEGSEEFDFARSLPSDNMLQSGTLDDNFLEVTASQIDFLEIEDQNGGEGRMPEDETQEDEVSEESTSSGNEIDFFVRKPKIKDE